MVEYLEAAPRGRTGGPGHTPRGRTHGAEEADIARTCERLWVDHDFVRLRRRHTLLCVCLVVLFLSGYLTQLWLSTQARELMAVPVAGPVNVALVSGLGQFLLVFVLAWAFGRCAHLWIDPLAARVRSRLEAEHGPGAVGR